MKVLKKFFKRIHTTTTNDATHSTKNLPKSSKQEKKKSRRSFPAVPIARLAWFLVGIFVIVAAGFSFFLPIFKSATTLDYFDYVSELRSNILVAKTNEYFLKIYAVEKEYP